LLGHSASADGNHADIIDLLTKQEYKGQVIVPLSYGENEKYARKIKQRLSASGLQVEILDSFIQSDQYADKINLCQAAVFNSYRQLGLGNILLSLKNMLKVYLDEKNPSFQWLQNNGFIIFSVKKDLADNLKDGQLGLSPDQAEINRNAYHKLSDPNNNIAFLDQIKKIALSGQSIRY